MDTSKQRSVKELVESSNLTSIPNNYHYHVESKSESESESDNLDYDSSIPVIDISLLQNGTPHQRSQLIQDLANACQHWGFFMVVNHGVPETLMKSMMEKCDEFFNMATKEKLEFEGKHALDPIRYGTSFNPSVEEVHYWRDYLKIMVHPQFHCPTKPYGFSGIASEYCESVRRLGGILIKGISESLGLDELEIERTMNLKMGRQTLVANYYPWCPQPDIAIGLPPHSDHGLLTFLIQNQVDGLQIQHNAKWFSIHPLPHSILVNTADQLEMISNGKYKSVLHKAVVNTTATRISIGIAYGPSMDVKINPMPQLVNHEDGLSSESARYKSTTYREYMHTNQITRLHGKSLLDTFKI